MASDCVSASFEQAVTALEPLWEAGYDEGVPRRGGFPASTLKSCMLDMVVKRAGEPHIVYRGTTMTFMQTNEMACRLAHALRRSGLDKGDRVSIMLGNVPELIVAYLACYKSGLIAVGLNPRSTVDEICMVVQGCGARMMITSCDRMRTLVSCAKRFQKSGVEPFSLPSVIAVGQDGDAAWETERLRAPFTLRMLDELLAAMPTNEPETDVAPNDIAALVYTGGTTGVSKGCPLTHRSLVQAQRLFFGVLRPLLHDARAMTSLVTSPMTHAYGLNFGVNWGVVVGGTVVLAESLDGESLVRLVEARRPQVWGAVPALLSAINASKQLARFDLSSLKAVVVSCAAASREVVARFEDACDARIIQDYGMTETAGPITLTPALSGASEGSVGFPATDTDVLVVDLEAGEKPVPCGMRGEVVFRGPQIASGYWKAPEETDEAFHGAWLYSGDVGYFDERGCLFVVDRIKDIVCVGGFSVFPREIDETLLGHPGIRDACTIGVLDARSGERPKSFIVLDRKVRLSKQEIVDYCHEHLIAYKCPKYVEFVDAIPLTRLGKPDKEALRKRERAEDHRSR